MTHPIVARLRDPDPGQRRAACGEAARDASAVLLLDDLCVALGDPDPAVARAAGRALGDLAVHRDALRAALDTAVRAGDQRRRVRAALAWARLEPPPLKLLPLLVGALDARPGDLRWSAARALVDMGRLHDEIYPALLGLARTDDRPRVRAMSLHVLRELAPHADDTVHALLDASRARDVLLRRAALSGLASLRDPDAAVLARLREAAADDNDEACRVLANAAARRG